MNLKLKWRNPIALTWVIAFLAVQLGLLEMFHFHLAAHSHSYCQKHDRFEHSEASSSDNPVSYTNDESYGLDSHMSCLTLSNSQKVVKKERVSKHKPSAIRAFKPFPDDSAPLLSSLERFRLSPSQSPPC